MSSGQAQVPHCPVAPAEFAGQHEDLVQRVAAGSAFRRAPKLRAFFLHVCRCALDHTPEAATEQQIGVQVYDRPLGYDPNEDNIVRSQARLLRMKLDHHFASEGKDEAIVITIPKGHYLPSFSARPELPPVAEPGREAPPKVRKSWSWPYLLVGAGVLCGFAAGWLGSMWSEPDPPVGQSVAIPAEAPPPAADAGTPPSGKARPAAVVPTPGEIRIAAGRTSPVVDIWGRRWEADHYFQGGVSRPGPKHFFPPVADDGMLRTMREAVSADAMTPQWFRYDIPLGPGVYELRLYFADPLRQPEGDSNESCQNVRRFRVDLNGQPLLEKFDPVADAGSSAVDIRAFRDVTAAEDGKLHLQFSGGFRPFLNALELTPGTPGKVKPIRIRAHWAGFTDADGNRWSGDNYFIDGRPRFSKHPEEMPKLSPVYIGERYGNFSYAIPVPPGRYTVRLHFLESFFSPLIPAAGCQGTGCRVFEVTCNGVLLLPDFDVVAAAAGAFRPVVREFHGLRPNGQGKLLLGFSPKVNYAEVRAIEVLDEAR